MTGRRLFFALAAGALVIVAFAAVGYREATSPPIVRRLVIAVPGFPAKARPVRVALFSDLHVHGPDMPPERVGRIVDQINSLHPDIVVAAGDFVGDSAFGANYSAVEALSPLRRFSARLGVYAVLGNNDHAAGAAQVVGALRQAGVRVLLNDASPAGPVALGGLDGRVQGRRALVAARRKTYAAIERTTGVKVLIVHRPDEIVATPRSVGIVLAGHTHCGQIVLPIVGALLTGSDYGRRYVCGLFRERGKVLVVTAGVGTSHVPLRIGAPPDIWLITIRGAGDPPQARS